MLALACAAHSGPEATARTVETRDETAVELAPGVVVSADRATVFLMASGGGIEAIALAAGEVRWRSAAGARPLGVASGRLLAQTEPSERVTSLRLAVLDPATGEAARAPIEVPLPPGVTPRIDDALGEEFRLGARARDAELVLEWSFVERPVTGVSPAPGEPPAVERRIGGARVDPLTGAATLLGPGELAPDEAPPEVTAIVDAAGAVRSVWRSDGMWAGLEQRREAGGGLWLWLHRWPGAGGAAAAPIELFRGRGAGALPSADGRHVMVGAPAAPGSGLPWVWRLYAVADGETAGSLPAETSLVPFVVVGTGVLHLAPPVGRRVGERWIEQPLRLRMASLGDGAERWTRPVRDVAFRGPRPPAG